MKTTNIQSLVDSINRAEKTGLTDDDLSRSKQLSDFAHHLYTICNENHSLNNSEKLNKFSTEEICNVLCAVLAQHIITYQESRLSGLLFTQFVCEILLKNVIEQGNK